MSPALCLLGEPDFLHGHTHLIANRLEKTNVIGSEFVRRAATNLDRSQRLFLRHNGHDDG